MPLRSPSLLIGCLSGLLLGGLVGGGCTPDSSGSPSPSDTTATTVKASPRPPRDSSAETLHTPRSKRGSSPTAVEDTPPPSPADDARTVAQRLSDASVGARVKQALVRVETLRRFNFSPSVVRGHLVLRGDVNTREQYRRAERVATNVEGVRKITNQVTVQGRSPSDAGDAAEATYHTVGRGDTLTEIARAYNVSVQQLRALNDLSGTLQPGQRIRVR